MFDKDVSQLAKPDIKGRAFVGSGNEIIETQTYYTVPNKDWVFDENLKISYNNPVFLESLELQGRKVEELNTGWVEQFPLDKTNDEDIEEELDEEDDFMDDDFEDENDDMIDFSTSHKLNKNTSSSQSPEKSEEITDDLLNDLFAEIKTEPPKENLGQDSNSINSVTSETVNNPSVNKPQIKLNINKKNTKIKLNINK